MAVAGKKKIFDGKYEILSIVGRGSRSVVYHARNTSDDDNEVALKVLIENKKDTVSNSEKLRREALAMVSSHHPYVVRLDDFHSVGDICYLSMEYAPEADLRKYTTKLGGKLPIDQCENFIQQVTEGLEYIHRVGIIHRDIKPDNILVVDDKSIRIGDFGVSLLPGDESAPQDLSNAVGTMDYMAPEVLEGIDYNQRSDIYSLGVSFYEMLTGQHPFAGASLANQLSVRQDGQIEELSSLRQDIPVYLSEAIMKAMSNDPKDRFSSAKELLQHLRQKRVQKNPTPTSKKEERIPPQLTVISGSQGQAQTTEKISEETPIETAQSEEKIVEIQEINPYTPENVTSDPEPSPKEAEPVAPESQISVAEDTVLEPNAPESTEETMQASDTTPIERSSQPQMKKEAPLKDSRASRNPTVFIAKETAEEIRKESVSQRPTSRSAIARRKIVPKTAPSSNNFTFGAIAVVFLLSVLTWKIFFTHPNVSTDADSDTTMASESALPAYQGEPLSFPNLPQGVYIGALTGLVPNSQTTVTAISFGQERQLALILGIEGWTPTILNIGNSASTAIRVISNGFILEFSGQVENGIIKGTYRNLVTGTTGSFALKPAKSLHARA